MPNLFKFRGLVIFFWAMENDEPVHVHVQRGRPLGGSTKGKFSPHRNSVRWGD